MLIKASAKFVRGSPRKVRLVAKTLTGLSPLAAIAQLSLTRKRAVEPILKVVKQALANAKNNFKLSEESLKISKVVVGDGPRMKRMDKSHGARFDGGVIKKRFFHLFVVLESGAESNLKVAEKPKTEKLSVTKEKTEEKFVTKISSKGRPRKNSSSKIDGK